MIDFKGNWGDFLSLIAFAYNNNYQSRTGMTPFDGRFISPIGMSSFDRSRVSTLGYEDS